jgi:hypothetical protein
MDRGNEDIIQIFNSTIPAIRILCFLCKESIQSINLIEVCHTTYTSERRREKELY